MKRLFFLLILPFIFLTPCQGSPERVAPFVEHFHSWGLYCALMDIVKKEIDDA